ncbi:MAG: hypothetical protein ACRESO_06065 [Gammaproteobacteria bacterium]
MKIVYGDAEKTSTSEVKQGDDWMPVVALAAIAGLIALVLTKKK